MTPRLFLVVMGVSGCGKTTVAEAAAARLGLAFIEGDALHPEENVRLMSSGRPLADEHRWPWLDRVGQALRRAGADGGGVAACSALRLVYRDRLRQIVGADLRFAHLDVSRRNLARRLSRRKDHFMPASLLASQLNTLEPPLEEPGALIIRDAPIAGILRTLGCWLNRPELLGERK